MTSIAIFDHYPRLQREMQEIQALSQFQHQLPRSIEFHDEDGRTKLGTIDDPEVLIAFGKAIADAEGYESSRGPSTRWYVVINGEPRREYLWGFSSSDAAGRFVEKHGNSTRMYGSFQSQGLRPWIERHMMKQPLKNRRN